VVTTKREAHLPVAATFMLQPNHNFAWRIETHGSYASTDEAAGPEGFLDTCGYDFRPRGATRGKGSFAETSARQVSIKP
jgi:hypothetical protein